MKSLLNILITIVNRLGYGGICAAVGLEYACFPISSELLLPFIGYTVSKGEMSLVLTIIFSTTGGIMGCFFCYAVGRFGGKFIDRTLCRRFRTVELGIAAAKRQFNKYGRESVLIARVFPIARTYISIPAGMTRMPLGEFILYSGIGALVWNTALISIGYFLGEHWSEAGAVLRQNKILIYMGVCFLALIVLFVLYRKPAGIKKQGKAGRKFR